MLVSPSGAKLQSSAPATTTEYSFNNPDVWELVPAFQPPLSDVEIKRFQDRIDGVIGTTADRGSGETAIIKLVWNGDLRYWHRYYMAWDHVGRPTREAARPRARYKRKRGARNEFVRDVFPPRWVLLARLEPEQYEKTWSKESFFVNPETGMRLPIRDPNPPKVWWMNLAVIQDCDAYCCKTADENKSLCYGKYAGPEKGMDTVYAQYRAMQNTKRNPFAEINSEDAAQYNDAHTGYLWEMKELLDEAEVMMAHPEALIGVQGGHAADIGPKRAKEIVKEYYSKQIARLGEMAGKLVKGK